MSEMCGAEVMEDSSEVSLDKLLKADFILSDSDPVSRDFGNWYYKHIYPVSRISRLDEAQLEELSSNILFLINWFSQKNVYTVEGVVGEISGFKEVISNKLAFLKRDKEYRSTNYGDKISWSLTRTSLTNPENKSKEELLSRICLLYSQVGRKAARSIFKPQDTDFYGFLEKDVLQVTEATHAKQDYSEKYDQPARPSFSHTDEVLVASALYRSIRDNASTYIITADSDIGRILAASQHKLRKENPGMFLQTLRNPIKVYFTLPGRIGSISADTSRPDDFNINSHRWLIYNKN